MARRQGATDAQLEAVSRAEYHLFDESWRAAFAFADSVTPTPGKVNDEVFARLAAHWNATQVVEITAVISIFNFFNRFANALEIPITR